MPDTTAGDLIKLALKTAGPLAVGQIPAAEDANDSLTILNSMMASWQQKRWDIFHLVDIATPSTNAQTYSIGVSGSFNTTRPDNIQAAYARLLTNSSASFGSGPVDYPLQIIQTYEEYAAIGIKQLHSFPSLVFYDPTPVLGTLYFWPIPSTLFELHVIVKDTLQQFPSLTTVIALPPEYFEALFWNLVARLQILYQLPVNPGVVALAKAALNTIKVANSRIANLKLPAGLSRKGGSWSGHGLGGVQEGTFTLNVDLLG